MKRFLFCITIISAIFYSCETNGQSKSLVAPKEASDLLKKDQNIQLVDVRTSGEYKKGHLKDAALIDFYGNFKSEVKNLDKSKPVMVYCAVGGRSAKAAKILRNAGFNEVYDMKGGIQAWNKSGLPIEK